MATLRRAPAFVLGLLGVLSAISLRGQATFDYYTLSLSWAPEFCAQPGRVAANPKECESGRDVNFVVHGLWPEATTGRGPESCGPAKPVAKGIVNSLMRYMPSAGLIQHEWATHGACTGLSADDYFMKVLQARAAVQIPVQLTSRAVIDTETPAHVEELFAGANPAFPKAAFRTACRAGALTEVRICFDKNIKARACTAAVGDCASRTLTIRPPR